MLRDRVNLIRLHHWVKNVFVFAPAFFAFSLFDRAIMARSALAALAFSLVSSGVYVFNDIADREADRHHPFKKDRPIAGGRVGVSEAALVSAGFIGVGLSVGWFLGWSSLWVLGLYLVTNGLYSYRLKHLPIVDVFCVAAGFLLRVVMGGTATSIPLSQWILVMTFLLALFLAFAKRRDDLLLALSGNGIGRKSLDGYNLVFLNAAMVLCASVLLVAYLMYGLDPAVMLKMGSPYLYSTFLFVLMGVLRYLQLAFVKNDSGSPTRHFYRDPVLRFVLLGWVGLFLLLLYGPRLHLFG
jgi:4-hydroxybenzoate polyprenyltransferase